MAKRMRLCLGRHKAAPHQNLTSVPCASADIDDDFLDDTTVWEDGTEELLAPGVNLLKVSISR